MKKKIVLLCVSITFLINNLTLVGSAAAGNVTVSGSVYPKDADPFTVVPGPAGSGECHLSWHTSFTPNIDSQELHIWGPDPFPEIRTLPFTGPNKDESLIVDNLLIGKEYSFNLFAISGSLMSPGVWTVPSTCTPLPAQDPPVMQEEPLQTVGTSNIVYFNNGQLVDMPGLRCKVTAMRGFDRVYVGDSGWIECPTAPADPAVFNYSYEFTGLSLNQTYYYHTQSTSDPVDPPTGGFSGYSNEVSSRQISGGSSGGGLPPNFCGDGSVGGTEECDDGNNIDGDGCSSDCKIELYSAAMCGDGIIQAPEECDDGNNNDGDGCSAACEIEEIVNVRFVLKAVPEFRTAAATHPNLGLNAILGFYKPAIANLTSASVVLDNNGNGTFEASIVTGSYDIAINGEAHLNKILREIVIDETTREITLDFSIGDTWQLTAGDTKDDNSINALDMASMIAAYRSSGGINDLNKFGGVNSIDMAILLLNYKRAGDQWLL